MKKLGVLEQLAAKSESGAAKIDKISSPGSRSALAPLGNPVGAYDQAIERPAHPKVPRNALGHPLKGYSLNVAGRMPGVPAYIRGISGDLRELCDHAFRMMRGEIEVPEIHWTPDGTPIEYVRLPSHKEQSDARRDLFERVLGKPAQPVDVTGRVEQIFDPLKYTVEELLILRELVAKGQPETVEGEIVPSVPDSDS